MDKPINTYRICYKMECFVQAEDEEEAMEKYGDGETEETNYVEFLYIEPTDPENLNG